MYGYIYVCAHEEKIVCTSERIGKKMYLILRLNDCILSSIFYSSVFKHVYVWVVLILTIKQNLTCLKLKIERS